jgi:hypothetical protein
VAAVVIPHPHDPDFHDRWDAPVALRLVAPPRRRPTPSVYRRRRLVAAVAVCLFTAVVLLATGSVLRSAVGALGGSPLTPPGAPDPTARPVAAQTIVVQSGDTLWSLARRMQPSGDVRPLVDKLAAAHRGTALQPGDRIPVP